MIVSGRSGSECAGRYGFAVDSLPVVLTHPITKLSCGDVSTAVSIDDAGSGSWALIVPDFLTAIVLDAVIP